VLPLFLVLALLASALTRSPIAVAAALGVGAASRWRGAPAAVAAAVVLGIALLRYDPFLPRRHPLLAAAAVVVLLLCAMVVPVLEARGGAAIQPDADDPPPTPAQRQADSSRSADFDASVEEDVLLRLLTEIKDTLGADDAVLWQHVAETDALVVISAAGPFAAGGALSCDPPHESLVRWAVSQKMPASNYDTDRAFFLVAPTGKGARFHGAVGIYAADRTRIDRDRCKQLIVRYAGRAGVIVDLLSDGREARRYRGKTERLAHAAEHVLSKNEMTTLGEAICATAIEISGATRSAFVRWNEETGTGSIDCVSVPHALRAGFTVDSDSLVGIACRERLRGVRSSYDRSGIPLFAQAEPDRPVHSVVIVPIVHRLRTHGAIVVEGDEPGQLSSVEGELLMLLSSVSSVALDNVQQFVQERDRALTDSLTGLSNRRRFEGRLNELLGESDRYGQPVSLILIDVDGFKSVNDVFGHGGGDEALIGVARVLAQAIRNPDLCARYGGDEFAILLPQTNLASACDVAERLRQSLSQHAMSSGSRQYRIAASFGVATYPESVRTHDTLVLAADKALYVAKNSGRNCVRMALPKHMRKSG